MSDITDWLNRRALAGDEACDIALGEITRLRAELAAAREALSDDMLAEIKRTIPVSAEIAAAIFYVLRHQAGLLDAPPVGG